MMNTIYIVMELCSGGELFDYALDQPGSKFTEPRAQTLAKKMLASLRYVPPRVLNYVLLFVVVVFFNVEINSRMHCSHHPMHAERALN